MLINYWNIQKEKFVTLANSNGIKSLKTFDF